VAGKTPVRQRFMTLRTHKRCILVAGKALIVSDLFEKKLII